MKTLGWFAFWASVAIVLWVAVSFLLAWLEVRGAPREPMFECERHGFFLRKDCIIFVGALYCPLCFEEKYRLAKKGQLRGA